MFRADVTWLELLTEPYGLDLLLMPASDAPVLEAHLRRRKYFAPGAECRKFAPEKLRIPAHVTNTAPATDAIL